jgi:hypothetical protein
MSASLSRADIHRRGLDVRFVPTTELADEKLKPRASDDLDHERAITLAIHAAIPDLIRDTNRQVIQAGRGCLMALARRFE